MGAIFVAANSVSPVVDVESNDGTMDNTTYVYKEDSNLELKLFLKDGCVESEAGYANEANTCSVSARASADGGAVFSAMPADASNGEKKQLFFEEKSVAPDNITGEYLVANQVNYDVSMWFATQK